MAKDFDGDVVVVTGASSGLGRAKASTKAPQATPPAPKK